MTTNSETDETEESIEETGWRDGEFTGDPEGFEKQLREDSDEELHETMDEAFSENVPRSSDPVQDRMERVAEGDASAAKSVLGGDGDDLEKRLEDASRDELLKNMVREIRANREAVERLADDEKGSPWTP